MVTNTILFIEWQFLKRMNILFEGQKNIFFFKFLKYFNSICSELIKGIIGAVYRFSVAGVVIGATLCAKIFFIFWHK